MGIDVVGRAGLSSRMKKNHFNRSAYMNMKKALLAAALLLPGMLLANPHEKQLANGMRVIVKEDHRAPTAVVVAVPVPLPVEVQYAKATPPTSTVEAVMAPIAAARLSCRVLAFA